MGLYDFIVDGYDFCSRCVRLSGSGTQRGAILHGPAQSPRYRDDRHRCPCSHRRRFRPRRTTTSRQQSDVIRDVVATKAGSCRPSAK